MDTYLSDVWFKVTDLEVATGSGTRVTTTDGTEYLDFTSGIGVVNTGHAHPDVVAAVREQAGRIMHAQVNVYAHDRLEEVAGQLAANTPDSIERFFLSNSGAEATEAAVKLVKQATRRPNVIVMSGSFHGRTAQTMAMTTSKTVYRAGHAPLPSGVFVTPFPYPFATDEDPDVAVERCLRELRLLLRTQTDPSETAAVFMEPVLGEGGYVPAPTAFVQGVADICREHELLLVVDEVQSGFGRTGTLFNIEQHGVDPDVLIMAKGMGSGFPISAVGASAELMAKWPVGSHGGTYGGNPMGCAAASATLDVMIASGFLDNVRRRGEQLRSGLQSVADESRAIGEVRGPGLMVATEIVDASGRPDPDRARAVLGHARDEGRLLLMTCGPYGSTVRWMPPLVADAADVDDALAAFRAAVRATA